MAQSFKETAHLKIDIKKYVSNFDQIDWGDGKKEETMQHPEPTKYGNQFIEESILSLTHISNHTHQMNVDAGWWSDIKTGLKKERNMGELLCLVHSEISEAMEGDRKNLMDDKLPHRSMLEVELADAIIRILDIAGSRNMDLGGAILEKMAFNKSREDHKMENRIKNGGKAY
jgi:NTP pyrophosphatase (non-canonical NTP hydrolase)